MLNRNLDGPANITSAKAYTKRILQAVSVSVKAGKMLE